MRIGTPDALTQAWMEKLGVGQFHDFDVDDEQLAAQIEDIRVHHAKEMLSDEDITARAIARLASVAFQVSDRSKAEDERQIMLTQVNLLTSKEKRFVAAWGLILLFLLLVLSVRSHGQVILQIQDGSGTKLKQWAGGVAILKGGTNISTSCTGTPVVCTFSASGSIGTSFDSVSAGTNTAALIIGTGGSLDVSGTGYINANKFKGNTTVAWADLNKTGSSLADLLTRACANLSDSGTACTKATTDFDPAGAATAAQNASLPLHAKADAAGAADTAVTLATGADRTKLDGIAAGATVGAATTLTLTAGAGLSGGGDLSTNRTFATDSTEAGFIAAGALTCGAATAGKMQVHTTPLQYCDNAATPTLRYGAYADSAGKATSATTADSATTAGNVSGTPALPNGTTATTQTAADNSTKLATTAYADAAAAARTLTIASGAKTLNTTAVGSAACGTAQTDTATGTAATDAIIVSFNASPVAVTGYVPLTTGMLTIIAYPTTNTVNFVVCNNTGASITPGAVTLNWRVVR